jgi:hypothetical protein
MTNLLWFDLSRGWIAANDESATGKRIGQTAVIELSGGMLKNGNANLESAMSRRYGDILKCRLDHGTIADLCGDRHAAV